MDNVQSYLANTLPYMGTLIKGWYYIFPISLALMFGYKFIPKIIIMLTGFIIGFSFVYPYLLSIQSFSDFVLKNPSFALPVQIVLGVVSAAAFWGLFKVLGFLGGFLMLGFLSKSIFDMIMNNSESLKAYVGKLPLPPHTMGWIVFIAFGVIGGIIVLKKTDEAIQFLSILVGSSLTAFYSLYGFEHLTNKGNMIKILSSSKNSLTKTIPSISNNEMMTLLILVIVYIFLVYFISIKMSKNIGRRKESHL